MRAWADAVADWSVGHHAGLFANPVGRGGDGPTMRALLDGPAPEEGRPFDAVFADFRDKIIAHSYQCQHPRFWAFVPGAPSFPAVLGDWLCAAADVFAGVWAEAPGPTQVELTVVDWFKQWLGFPADAGGLFTSGGSEANLTALAAARDPVPFADRDRLVMYASAERHWSVDRAAGIIGLRPDQVRPLPVDAEYRLRPEAFRAAVRDDRSAGRLPWLLSANAGSTNTGAVDPLRELAEACRAAGVWLHVDAAYGGPAVLTDEGRALFDSIGDADSVTLDPHKWLAQPFEAGCLLVRDVRRLTDAFALRPDYMEDVAAAGDEVNFCDRGIGLTRRFRSLKVWLSVQLLGVGWFRRLVEHCYGLADYLQATLEQSGEFEILSPRRLSVVCFRHVPLGGPMSEAELERLNRRLMDEQRSGGKAFLSSTRLAGRFALRACFVNWRTSADDVDAVVSSFLI
jgi:glutamate/tyrosine decarboxylase-like PLP-dependent enzyme